MKLLLFFTITIILFLFTIEIKGQGQSCYGSIAIGEREKGDQHLYTIVRVTPETEEISNHTVYFDHFWPQIPTLWRFDYPDDCIHGFRSISFHQAFRVIVTSLTKSLTGSLVVYGFP